MLFYYKYTNFFIENINVIFNKDISIKDIVLPIGISFYTFQGLSYLIDVYWNKVEVQKNVLQLALYISLFPQLVAGPIVRYIDIEKEMNDRTVSVNDFERGIQHFVIGLSKKIIIANVMGKVADEIFSFNPENLSLFNTWIGIIAYTIQIYFDFSGYSDMAIGLGKMFGFHFLENFDRPYTSKSITEFWRRWHISLSTFFRDYVYIPLGGNRRGNNIVNLFVVFVLTGIWHGAFIIIEKKLWKELWKKTSFIGNIYVMIVVCVGWVFFRADNLTYAIRYILTMVGLLKSTQQYFSSWYFLDKYTIFIFILSILLIYVVPFVKKTYFLEKIQERNTFLISKAGTLLIFLVTIMKLMTSTYNPFIYFRF